jgi:hypothetical protein
MTHSRPNQAVRNLSKTLDISVKCAGSSHRDMKIADPCSDLRATLCRSTFFSRGRQNLLSSVFSRAKEPTKVVKVQVPIP